MRAAGRALEGRSGKRPRAAALLTAIALPVLALAACEAEVTAPLDEEVEGEVTLDATSAGAWAYLSFEDGGRVIVPSDPSTSTEWHIAFRRYAAKLNGGVAGPGAVEGYNIANHAGATADEVLAFTLADADAAWEAVTSADVATADFREDELIEDTGGSWFRFDAVSNTLVANSAAAWKVDEVGTGFAVFRVSDLNLTPAPDYDPLSLTIQYRHQPAGGVLGAIGGVTVDLTGGDAYVDLATGSAVVPSGCNWDLRIDPELAIEVNDACGAGTFPLDVSEDFTTVTTASGAPTYGGFLAVLSGAFPTTVGDATGLFWYNLDGSNRLFPTYNVFLVRAGTDVYKVQVLDYYSATGASGHPTLRFQRLP